MRPFKLALALVVASVGFSACTTVGSMDSAKSVTPSQGLTAHAFARPSIVDQHEYKTRGGASNPIRLVAAADGSVWVALDRPSRPAEVLHMSQFGAALSRTIMPSSNEHFLGNLALGSDGAYWVDERQVSKIARIGSDLKVTEFALPQANSDNLDIVSGPDGRLWFTEYGFIGAITTSGQIAQYPIPNADSATGSVGVASGPDGNVWFTQQGPGASNFVDRITPGGIISQFPVTSGARPFYITPGPDGALWFTEPNQTRIGRITTAGAITEFSTPHISVENMLSGVDGNLWAGLLGGPSIIASVASISTSGQITTYPPPPGFMAQPIWLTSVPGRRILWLAEYVGKAAKISY